ncbi:MAG: hypothetical protein ACI4JW_09910 [Oscillospiraceae bacterium]
MKIKRIGIAKGHLHIETNNAEFIRIPGEMTLINKFYVDSHMDWYWIDEPTWGDITIDNLCIISLVTDSEKKR